MGRKANKLIFSGLVLVLAAGMATAGWAAVRPQEMARAHWAAIAKNDLHTTMKGYSRRAVLDWVGGPLNGKYRGPAAIAKVWKKFFKAQGPLAVTVRDLKERRHAGRQIVTARTIFKGRKSIPVNYTLVYRSGRLLSETWKIHK